MYARDQPRARTIVVVILQQQLSSFFVQCRFRVGVNQQTLDRDENMADAVLRLPVLLQRVDANLACRANVGVEDLRRKPACVAAHTEEVRNGILDGAQMHAAARSLTLGGSRWKLFCKLKLDPKVPSGIGCALCTREARETRNAIKSRLGKMVADTYLGPG